VHSHCGRHNCLTVVDHPVHDATVGATLAMDEPGLQLQQNLRDSTGRALACRRPILSHLNADTTWLLQLPYPPRAIHPKGRSRFHILIDPWLEGAQVDVASWFSKQWHSTKSSVTTIAQLNEHLKEIESIVEEQTSNYRITKWGPHEDNFAQSFIDAVIISHEFTDHCNKDTLLQIHPDTPVFATKVAANSIRSWEHFQSVQDTPIFAEKNLDCTATSLNPLPKWLGISRLVTKTDALYFHSAILITFNLGIGDCMENQTEGGSSEAIVYTPHGIHAQDLRHLLSANPPIQTLALIHGLHDVTISGVKKLNLGAHNGLRAQRTCKAKYWVSTHDEVKEAQGLIAPLLKRKVITHQEAVEHEKGQSSDEDLLADVKQLQYAELSNGESLLLI